ncbi:MAG: glycosyl hydrolase 53 family protein [Proteobacteria bacterium]|nr:glycosyl hydrolase 53 family protein [Pseudomonadota bacterium]
MERIKSSVVASGLRAGLDRRTFILKSASTLGMLSAGLQTACGGGGSGGSVAVDNTPPEVSAVVPADNAVSVGRDAVVELTFSEPVSVAADGLRVTGPLGPVAGTLSTNGSKLRLTPSRPLGFGQTYSVALSATTRDLAGNPATASTTTFQTKSRNPALGLGAHLLQTVIYEAYRGPTVGVPFNAVQTLVDNGFEWARTQVTTLSFPELAAVPPSMWGTSGLGWKEGYWSCLEMSAAVLQEAARAGMRLQVGFFLSDGPANAGSQPRPAAWANLDDAALAVKVGEHTRSVAAHYKSLGLNIEVFEFGSECDVRLCGYDLAQLVIPPGVHWESDPQWMFDNLWVKFVPLFKAAVQGVRAVFPGAAIMLHTNAFAYSPDNMLAKAFYKQMIDAGVEYDIAGLSYPYMQSTGQAEPQPYFAQAEFITTIETIRALGKRVQITEFNYPAAPAGQVKTPAAAYPFTPEGQAAFVTDFAHAVRGMVERINYWAPDVFTNVNGPGGIPVSIESCGLFESATQARLAMAVFNRIAEGELLS